MDELKRVPFTKSSPAHSEDLLTGKLTVSESCSHIASFTRGLTVRTYSKYGSHGAFGLKLRVG